MGGIFLLVIFHMRLVSAYRAPLVAAIGETAAAAIFFGGSFALILIPATLYFLIEPRIIPSYLCPACHGHLLELQPLWRAMPWVWRACRRTSSGPYQIECPHCGELISAVKPSRRQWLMEYASCSLAMLGPIVLVKFFF